MLVGDRYVPDCDVLLFDQRCMFVPHFLLCLQHFTYIRPGGYVLVVDGEVIGVDITVRLQHR